MESYEYTGEQNRSRTLVVVLEKEQYLVSWKSTNIMKVILTLYIPKGVFPIPRDHFQKMMSDSESIQSSEDAVNIELRNYFYHFCVG